MGGCQDSGLFLGPCYNTAPNIEGTQKGTIILTTTHMRVVFVKLLLQVENSLNPNGPRTQILGF